MRSTDYIKNSTGRGVLLANSNIIAAAKEKEALQKAIASLQTQIDRLQERILELEKQKGN